MLEGTYRIVFMEYWNYLRVNITLSYIWWKLPLTNSATSLDDPAAVRRASFLRGVKHTFQRELMRLRLIFLFLFFARHLDCRYGCLLSVGFAIAMRFEVRSALHSIKLVSVSIKSRVAAVTGIGKFRAPAEASSRRVVSPK